MKFYWEINPEDLLKNGNYEKNNLSECAYNLMIMYNKYAEKGKKFLPFFCILVIHNH